MMYSVDTGGTTPSEPSVSGWMVLRFLDNHYLTFDDDATGIVPSSH